MRRWFLSYNSQDLALMQAFEAALRRKDPEAYIFFAPKSLRAGGYWLPELAREIVEASALVLLIGEKGLGPWQIAEYYEAIDRRVKEQNFPVVLVLLDGQAAPGLPFLRQLHWIITPDPASEQSLAKLMDAVAGGETRPGELWRHTAPYRGLAAMTEAESDFFLGRKRETVEVIAALEANPDKLPVLLGNSGVGKSSLAQAGVLAALARQGWPEDAANAGPWPKAFHDSRRWCFLNIRPGAEPLKALVEPFLRTWQLDPKDTARAKLQSNWIKDLLEGTVTLSDLLDATELHYQDELHQPKPPSFFLYVDQGEELYVRAEEHQRRRFSEIVAHALGDPRLRALMSLRSDFLGALQNDEPLFVAHRKIDVPPLREADLREVVSKPAAILGARFETDSLAVDVARRAAEESAKDAGALPLLSYLLDDMWTHMVKRGDGVLRLPAQAVELGGVLAERADAFVTSHPGAEAALRRLLTLKLATVRPDGEPSRRRALRSEFTDAEWHLISELADHPHRLLITATPESGETYADVAHEAIFRRWEKLREWISQEREFLAWRNEIEAARTRWQTAPEPSRSDALLMGRLALAQAKEWLQKRRDDLPPSDREFIDASLNFEALEQKQKERLRSRAQLLWTSLVLLVAVAVAVLVWSYQWTLKVRVATMFDNQFPKVLAGAAERALIPKNIFKECTLCPEMVVVPGGEFITSRKHKVTIANAFAVSRFEVTFDEYDTCVELGGCEYRLFDRDWGRGSQPVINVDWYEAQAYAAWLSKFTGKRYRLLSEAEWEYAARAGSDTNYSWGNEIGNNNANCKGCGSQWGGKRPAPVGSFAPNAFGLYDMHGNVSEWVEDWFNDNIDAMPYDNGSPVRSGNWELRIIRGGSWAHDPAGVSLQTRYHGQVSQRGPHDGFRIARSLVR